MAAPKNSESLALLLVDDDAELCEMMREFFVENGHRLDCEHNGRDGLARAVEREYDLVILDVMLPAISGFTLLHQLRRRRDVPVILLTARTAPQDRIMGLETGADDYLPKPFDPDELLARIRAVLRRSGKHLTEDSPHIIGELRIHPRTREVWMGKELVDLTAVEFDILDLLVRSAGRVLARDEISLAILERQPSPYDRSLDVHISHLRKKLEQAGDCIQTIRGVGYLFTKSQ
ncbi:MAG TPA: response regulator transcription factor [Terriglobales bacterium]|nr:response regulator transcription factor [Terriglobales bacterium]